MFDSRRVLSLEKSGTAAIWLADDATHLENITGLHGKSAMITNIMNYAIASLSEKS